MELQTLQEALKVEIQVHQVCFIHGFSHIMLLVMAKLVNRLSLIFSRAFNRFSVTCPRVMLFAFYYYSTNSLVIFLRTLIKYS